MRFFDQNLRLFKTVTRAGALRAEHPVDEDDGGGEQGEGEQSEESLS